MSFFNFSNRVLASLFQKPSTLMYPVVPRQYYKNTRGSIDFNIDTCTYCGLCQKKCPTYAITVDRKEKTWTIDRLSCIACNSCVDTCPKKSLIANSQYSPSVTFRPENEVFKAPPAEPKVEKVTQTTT